MWHVQRNPIRLNTTMKRCACAVAAMIFSASTASAVVVVSNAFPVQLPGAAAVGVQDMGIIANDIDPVSGPPPAGPLYAADSFTGIADLLNSPGIQGTTSFNSLTVSPANNLAPAPVILTIPSPGFIFRNQPAGGLFGGASTIINNKGGAYFSLGDAGVGTTVSSTYASWTATYNNVGVYNGNIVSVLSYQGTLPLGGAMAFSGNTTYKASNGDVLTMPQIVLGVTDTAGVGGFVSYADGIAGPSAFSKAIFSAAGGGALNFKIIGIDIVPIIIADGAHFTAWSALSAHADPDATGSSIDLSDWSPSDLSGLTLPGPNDALIAETDDLNDVPEPATAAALCFASLALLTRRRM
jgi:hypothetical protein